jgi:type I restriction-modification system DNA methylase subunit
MPNEADTCRQFVVPKLVAAGWEQGPHIISEQAVFTDGRIVVAGAKVRTLYPSPSEFHDKWSDPAKRAQIIEQLKDRGIDFDELASAAVILTNAPFGGEEERGILNNFPADKQTAETALLFLQLIMRKLRRRPKPGRAGVVVPNGTLFGDGVCARIKEELLKDFNLRTIVRLPNGVFAPYTSIPTNLLFFDRTGPTKDIWFYEQPLPTGPKNYTKTQPIQFDEFADCLKW